MTHIKEMYVKVKVRVLLAGAHVTRSKPADRERCVPSFLSPKLGGFSKKVGSDFPRK